MKKLFLMIVAAAMFMLASPAYADSVTVETQISFSRPSASNVGILYTPLAGGEQIVFAVAGKTCTLAGSANHSAPQGCNYTLTIAPGGGIAAKDPNAPQYGQCTAPAAIASSCN
ncbi:hypothetical protein NIES4074_40640 [Cylindrospermum sp. NIES-4074]|nr:hypothetical protein NIES4074_40640 [Cylindrospermum sp. NIES-4074]